MDELWECDSQDVCYGMNDKKKVPLFLQPLPSFIECLSLQFRSPLWLLKNATFSYVNAM